MKRRLLQLVTVVSLLLTTTLAALWVRSHVLADRVALATRVHGTYSMTASAGITYVSHDSRRRRFASPWEEVGYFVMGWFDETVEVAEEFEWSCDTADAGSVVDDPFDRGDISLHFDFAGIRYGDGPHYPPLPPGVYACRRRFVPPFSELAVPMQYPVALFGLLAVVSGMGLRRLRPPPGFCRCGYDLRATPNRCPECGRVTA